MTVADIAAAVPANRQKWRPGPRLVGAASLIAGVLAWQAYALAQDNNLFVPTVPQVVEALAEQVQTAEFWSAYSDTLVPFAYGWLAAIVLGVLAGLVMGQSRVLTGLLSPYLSFLNALPISTLVPIIVIGLGIEITARAVVVFLFAIVEVVLTTAAGVRYVDPDLVAMARSFGMSRPRRFVRVMLPGSMPGIAAAVRVGTGRAVVGMIVMELLLVSVGVGKLISRYKDGFQSADLYAVVVSLAVFGLIVLALTRRLERRMQRWRPDEGDA